jgi:hypothetical protein
MTWSTIAIPIHDLIQILTKRSVNCNKNKLSVNRSSIKLAPISINLFPEKETADDVDDDILDTNNDDNDDDDNKKRCIGKENEVEDDRMAIV